MTKLDRQTISDGLRKLGVIEGSALLVHSSLSSFGHVEGGAEEVIAALLESVGGDGTVVVPTLTGSEHLSPSNPPVFDPQNSKSWTGRIPETFRQRPDAIRSLHPTHSAAAIGKLASELTAAHVDSTTPCDEISPYGKIAGMEHGYVLLIGVGHGSNTTFHHVEELAGVPYHMQTEFTRSTVVREGSEVSVNSLLHQYGTPRRFEVMEPLFVERGIQKNAQIGNSTVRLVHARGMTEVTLRAIRANERILCK